MTDLEITFTNKAEIRVQAQIYTGRTLISTCLADPGQVCTMPSETDRYDVFLKDGATGWEVARKLDIAAKNLTLIRHKGRYIIT
jgi:hypothetical protein